MLKFIARRLLSLIPILLGISFVSSVLFYIVPGDIVTVMMGQHVDPLTYANVRKALGLDLPFWENFVKFMEGVFRGDLGYSYIQQRPVNQIILEALPVTLKLTIMALLLSCFAGIPVGVIVAAHNTRVLGNLINYGAAVSYSLPSFLLAIFLQFIFGVSLGWLPVAGSQNGLFSYILPGIAAGLPWAVLHTRLARASMLEVINQDYILFALSKGLSGKTVIVRHGLINAILPVLTNIGVNIGGFMSGFVLIETIFNLPGMGRLVYSSINTHDFPVLRGMLFISAIIAVLANLFVDLIHAKIDPRMTTEIVKEEIDEVL